MNQNRAFSVLNSLPDKIGKHCRCNECGACFVKPDEYFCCPNGHGKLIGNLQLLLNLEHEMELWKRKSGKAPGFSGLPKPSSVVRALEVFREKIGQE